MLGDLNLISSNRLRLVWSGLSVGKNERYVVGVVKDTPAVDGSDDLCLHAGAQNIHCADRKGLRRRMGGKAARAEVSLPPLEVGCRCRWDF